MKIRFGKLKSQCPKCGENLAFPRRMIGEHSSCPECGARLYIAEGQVITAGISITTETDRSDDDGITERQAAFLRDLGETSIPEYKADATEQISSIVDRIMSCLSACFRKRHDLDRPTERALTIAIRKSSLYNRLPTYGEDLTDDQRIELIRLVIEVLGKDTARSMGIVGIRQLRDRLGL